MEAQQQNHLHLVQPGLLLTLERQGLITDCLRSQQEAIVPMCGSLQPVTLCNETTAVSDSDL